MQETLLSEPGKIFYAHTQRIHKIMLILHFQIFLHEAGSEYWFQYELNPSKKSVVNIDTSTNDGTYGIEGILKYSVKQEVPRKAVKCDPNATMESYTNCAFDELMDYGCSPAINRIDAYFNDTSICKNMTEMEKKWMMTYKRLRETLYSADSSTQCMKPCQTTSFEVSLKKKHEHEKVLAFSHIKNVATPGNFLLNFKYDEFVIEHKKEYFVMDMDGLVSNIGGFLGLFLGSSCVSIIEWIGHQIKKCFN